MSTFISDDPREITSSQQLVGWLQAGEKPQNEWLIGSEHEKIIYDHNDLAAIGYAGEGGIADLLTYLAEQTKWQIAYEQGNIIGLQADNGASVSLEPGGQVELSGAPLSNLHQTCTEISDHLFHVSNWCKLRGKAVSSFGFNPIQPVDAIRIMPKERYYVLQDFLAQLGNKQCVKQMMRQSTTVQVNLDFANETDMLRKARSAIKIQYLVGGLFANSPFADGKVSGFFSYRNQIWLQQDPRISGIPAVFFDAGFGYESWIEYLLDLPYVLQRSGSEYRPAPPGSFRDFMLRRGNFRDTVKPPTFSDWQTHLTTLITDVRIKQFIEMRIADGQGKEGICALPAFWVGLLYGENSLDQLEQLVADWSLADVTALRNAVPQQGLALQFKGRSGWEWIADILQIAWQGLASRGNVDSSGNDETAYLHTLQQIVSTQSTKAEQVLAEYRNNLPKLYRSHSLVQPVN